MIDIRRGRHPVIEKQLPIGESYVANDVFLDGKSQQIIIVTGPNMSGKSALFAANGTDYAHGSDWLFCTGGKCQNRGGG